MGKIILKKIILILALICMIVSPIFRQTGDYPTSSNIVKCADYDHPDDAITAIGASNKTLLVTESETCNTNFNVPANVKVRFERGGKLTINNGITVTFNGQIDAGLWRIFSYTGTGTLAGTPLISSTYPQWWATGDGTVENPWANDCIQKAYDFVPDGGTIYLKAGYYTLSDTIKTAKKISIIGEGRNKSIIVLDIAHGNGIGIVTDYCTLKGFTIDGDSQLDGTQYLSPISIIGCDYALLEDIEVKNAGYYGINIYQVNHSLFQNIYAHDNYRHGLHPGSDKTGRNKYNIYRDIYAWNNGVCGFKDRGNEINYDEECYNIYGNLKCWDNGLYGIMIGLQRAGVLSNSFASGNGGYGIYLKHIDDFNVHDCSTSLNDKEGLTIEHSNDVNITNVIVKNNNVLNAANIGGIKVENSSRIKFTSCQSYDDRATKIQEYGIVTVGTSDFIEIINCILTPNEISSIYNDAGQ